MRASIHLLLTVVAGLLFSLPAMAGGPFLAGLSHITTVASTVPANGDVNPYGVAIVPVTMGALVKGSVLVSNFNNSSNLQGTGSTIVDQPQRRCQYLRQPKRCVAERSMSRRSWTDDRAGGSEFGVGGRRQLAYDRWDSGDGASGLPDRSG